jgi:hypothetical protein
VITGKDIIISEKSLLLVKVPDITLIVVEKKSSSKQSLPHRMTDKHDLMTQEAPCSFIELPG